MKKNFKAIDTHVKTKTSHAIAMGVAFLVVVGMTVLPLVLGLSTTLFAFNFIKLTLY